MDTVAPSTGYLAPSFAHATVGDEKARAGVPAEVLETTEVLHGSAAEELAAVSGALDLLICGSRGYGPVLSLVLGGVTSELAHTAHCPLLIVPRAPAGAGGVV